MVTVLVVDDSALDRHLAGSLLRRRAGFTAVFAPNGRAALDFVRAEAVDLVLTDLQMPEMDGLSLVEAMRREFPAIPVILMTAHGSEDIAVRALQEGAASFVPKRNLAYSLVATCESVLEITKSGCELQEAAESDPRPESSVKVEARFVLTNDLTSIGALVGRLEENLTRMRLWDQTGVVQVAVALREAIVNAIEHGNLELDSTMREDDYDAYVALGDKRRAEEPYASRRVHVIVRETRDEVTYVVADEGPGFDLASLPDPTDPANLEKTSGRGLLLIQTFMDEVRHNARGNEITMLKRGRPPASGGPGSTR